MGCQYNIKVFESLPDDETLIRMARCLWRGCPDKYEDGFIWWKNLFISKKVNNNFVVIADETSDIHDCISHVVFFQSSDDSSKWLISNLKTFTPFRRNGIAYIMLSTGIEKIKSIGGEKIYAFIDRENVPSINLHIKLGFVKQEKEVFDGFNQYDNEILYKLELNS
jgi:ribosomal protein S18 acetylase RimI-like enzyme